MSDGDDEIVYNDLDDEDNGEAEWEFEQGYLFIFRDRKAGTELGFAPGQWNDSGVDPSSYFIKVPDHFISINPERTYMEYTVPGESRRRNFEVPYPMKLSDFVQIVRTPFGLELSDGNMGKFYQHDEYDISKDIEIKIDADSVKEKILKISQLKAFL